MASPFIRRVVTGPLRFACSWASKAAFAWRQRSPACHAFSAGLQDETNGKVDTVTATEKRFISQTAAIVCDSMDIPRPGPGRALGPWQGPRASAHLRDTPAIPHPRKSTKHSPTWKLVKAPLRCARLRAPKTIHVLVRERLAATFTESSSGPVRIETGSCDGRGLNC